MENPDVVILGRQAHALAIRLRRAQIIGLILTSSIVVPVLMSHLMLRFDLMGGFTLSHAKTVTLVTASILVTGAAAAFIVAAITRRALTRVEVQLARWGARVAPDGTVTWR